MEKDFDLAVVGAGIVGLAHALAAARRNLRVIVFDRDAQANGASVRNFGFVTVTGQQQGPCWRRAMRSRDIWADVAPKAGIEVVHTGLAIAVRRSEAVAVLEAFRAGEMGVGCEMLTPAQAVQRVPHLKQSALRAVLWSPHELRIETRLAIPQLADWLERSLGVTIRRQALVKAIEPDGVHTSSGRYRAKAVVVCPGDDFLSLYSERLAAYALTKCQLHMLRLAPVGGARLGAAVMSDLGLVRYLGYSELPQAAALKTVLAREESAALTHGVHLIAVQSADGSLVVGDSHQYGQTPPPFAAQAVDQLILDEFHRVFDLPQVEVSERWTGIYASAADRLMLVDAPQDNVRTVIITSGTGASTAFAIGEDVIDELFGT
jgi:FAD dependent oxidoreductase TIGR03364